MPEILAKKTLVIMLDADSCVFNVISLKEREKRELNFLSNHWIINGNTLLMNRIHNIIHHSTPDEVIFMSASSRQSFSIDKENQFRNNTGSFFPVIEAITKYFAAYYPKLKVAFNPFLLADVFSNLETGTSYSRIVERDFNETHANCPLEKTKKIWMYCAAHCLGGQYPGLTNKLECHFFDDSDDIINDLGHWTLNYPKLIPSHINLTLTQYDGNLPKDKYLNLKGTGMVDMLYQKSAKLMLTQIGISFNHNWAQEVENKQVSISSTIFTEKKLDDLREWSESIYGKIEMQMDKKDEEEDVEEIEFPDFLDDGETNVSGPHLM